MLIIYSSPAHGNKRISEPFDGRPNCVITVLFHSYVVSYYSILQAVITRWMLAQRETAAVKWLTEREITAINPIMESFILYRTLNVYTLRSRMLTKFAERSNSVLTDSNLTSIETLLFAIVPLFACSIVLKATRY